MLAIDFAWLVGRNVALLTNDAGARKVLVMGSVNRIEHITDETMTLIVSDARVVDLSTTAASMTAAHPVLCKDILECQILVS